MRRSPSLQWSDNDSHSPIQKLKLFGAGEPQQYDSDIASGELTVSELGWSDNSDSESDSPPPWDPISSSGPIRSSPINESDPDERAAHRRRKGYKKRARTLAGHKEDNEKRLRKNKREILDGILGTLNQQGLKVWDFMEHIFHPKSKKGSVQWQQFFSNQANVTQLLDWWTSSNNSRTARKYINQWIQGHVAAMVSQEARRVTKLKKLQTMGKKIDSAFASAFSFPTIHSILLKDAPFTLSVLESLATAQKAATHTQKRKDRTKMVVISAALACLGEYSHANNLTKRMIGMYMYASGAQRQAISVLSTLGLSESYSNLISKNVRRVRTVKGRKQKMKVKGKEKEVEEELEITPGSITEQDSEGPKVPTGTLYQLSESMRQETREIAATGLFTTVYDNININFRNPEEIIGRHDTQENGTCATLVPLFDAKIKDLNVKDLQSSFLKAPVLSITDIVHTKDERKAFKSHLIFTILRILVKHGGQGFECFQADLDKAQPETADKIKTHKSQLHPLPAWNIDESSITGNAEVIEAISKELHLDQVPDAAERVQFLAGDQLSIARLRALELIRAGHESGRNAMFWGAWIPGLFHAKIADALGTLLTHFGKPDTGSRDPNSLWYENTRLDRLPITVTSLPPFRKCRDLLFISLYARVLHCLLLVSRCNSLGEYLIKFTNWDDLTKHATMIFEQFANSSRVQELRGLEGEGDTVLENAILFMRDALISREFTDAVKAGDSGRVVLVLKTWALSYRGNGRTKYAYEMLHLIHHLSKLWPKGIRDIVLKNWLLNTTGHANSFVEIDLVQEHLNFWIKTAYKAHGSNASWDWLDTLAPTIEVLRNTARNFNDTLGADQGTRHAPPDLTNDIRTLMDSLNENNVYRLQKGRVLGEDTGGAVKDVILAGLHSLTEGEKTPLTEYNEAVQRLQHRRSMMSVAEQKSRFRPPSELSAPAIPNPPANPSPPLENPAATPGEDDSEGMLVDESVEREPEEASEEPNEIERILDDLTDGIPEPTLLRLSEEDVALDMDEVTVDVIDEESSDSDEDSEGSGE